jgi:hypothetical protein
MNDFWGIDVDLRTEGRNLERKKELAPGNCVAHRLKYRVLPL